MLYLFLAIFSSFLISFLMRLSTRSHAGQKSTLAANYLMCALLGAFHCGFQLLPAQEGTPVALGLGLFNGVLYLLGIVLMQRSIYVSGVVLSATFMKLGLLVPMALSVLVFREMPSAIQILGFCIVLAAIILINYEKDAAGSKFHFSLIALLLANGGGDAMSKVFAQVGSASLEPQFLLYTFLCAFFLCSALVIHEKEKVSLAGILYGLAIGVPNFYSARFLLMALGEVSAVIVYPCFSVGSLLLVTLAGVCFFRERLKIRQWIALGAILVALVLLNL